MTKSKEIKDDLRFITELRDLLEVMKNIAVFQFRALQRKKERFARFANVLDGFFQMLDMKKTPHNLINPDVKRPAVIMITSDEGFMGNLNFQVIDSAIMQSGAPDAEFIIIGETGMRYLRDMGKTVSFFKGSVDAGNRYSLALELKDYIMKGIGEGRFGSVFISYPKPVSFMIQTVEVLKILPLPEYFTQARKNSFDQPVIKESPVEGIINYLAEEFVLQKLMEILEDSKLSEFAARAIHLERSSQELEDKNKQLKSRYFRAYHEFIDKNTRQLFSAKVILAKKG